jgi:nucleoside-diphosphate-sugar epimerase
VNGLATILQHIERCDGEIINLGDDKVYSTASGIALVEQLLNKKAHIVTQATRTGDQLKTKADIRKARRLLNYTPVTSFREGLQAQIDWYKGHFCE